MKIGKSYIVAAVILLIIFGCIYFQKIKADIGERAQRAQMMMPTAVEVEEIAEKSFQEESDSTGRVRAKYSVDVVARINGWLEKRYFEEGAFVKKGQVLFLIEPREYNIAVSQAQAAKRQADATLVNAEKELVRAAELVKKDYVSKSYYDSALATRDQSKALYDMRKAELDNAKRNLDYTRIVSPIDGKIGKIYITEGNLVNQQTGKLATIVSNDPIYVDFNMKSATYIQYKRMEMDQKEPKHVSIYLRLADGQEYPYEGKIESVNNVVDETTGTISIRAVFSNPEGLLVPGDYVNVISKVKGTKKQIVVPQKAVLKSSGCSYVFVVNEVKDEKSGESTTMASARKVEIGNPIGDYWEVVSGLSVGEKVVVSGLTNIRLAPPEENKDSAKIPQQPVTITESQEQNKNKNLVEYENE